MKITHANNTHFTVSPRYFQAAYIFTFLWTEIGKTYTYLRCLLHIKVLTQQQKEGNVLFNNALTTLYLQLHGVDHMVKDHSESERGNPLQPLH